ncbi:MAG: PAS domain S-box protein [Candidatus Omnitrophica bacterium]|nr:PAS domain S-box protein [Candidatus Omnitrophota bacterium]
MNKEKKGCKDLLEKCENDSSTHYIKYKTLFDSSYDAIMILDPSLKFVEGNKATLKMFGCKKVSDFISKTPLDFSPKYQINGELSRKTAKKNKKIVMDKGVYFFEWLHKRLNGEEFQANVLITKMVLKGENFLQATVRDVSDSKRAEAESRKFKTISDHASYGCAIVDLHGKIEYLNDSFARMHGYSVNELTGKNLLMFHNEQQKKDVMKTNKELIKKGNYVAKEVWHVTKDGDVFPALMNASVIKDDKGRPLYISATAIDISELKKAEEKLKLFRHIMDHASDSLVIIDPETSRILDANKTAAQKLKCTFKEFLSKTIMDIDENFASFAKWKEHSSMVKRKGNVSFEGKNRASDGSSFPVEVNVKYIKGQQDCFLATIRDISKRKKTESDLKLFRYLMDNSTDSLFIIDPDTAQIVDANRTAAKRLRYSFQELLKKRVIDIDKQLPSFGKWEEDVKLIKEKGSAILEREHVRSDGTSFPVEICSKYITGGKNYFLAIVRDITYRKKTEQQIIKGQKELQERNKELIKNQDKLRNNIIELQKAHLALKETQEQLIQSEKLALLGQLSAGIAHEINNPIAFISSNIEVLEKYVQSYARVQEHVDVLKKEIEKNDKKNAELVMQHITELEKAENIDFINKDIHLLIEESKRGTDRIKNIVKDLGVLSRKDDQQMRLNSIEEILNGVINIIESDLKYRGVVKKDYQKTPYVLCNAQRIGQVFLNILANSAQAIKCNGEILIKTYKEDDNVCIEISDTGQGVPKKNLKKIFEPFFTTKAAGKGTGLGLSISHDFVKQHNGEISVDSVFRKGTKITVKLPCKNGENIKEEKNGKKR